MRLAVNIGNTNIRAALGDKDNIIAQTVFYVDEGQVTDLIEAGLGNDIWHKIKETLIATVVPSYTETVMTAIEAKTKKPVKRLNINKLGDLKIDQYQSVLGEDRAVCCARALQKYSPPFVVIDYGTAATINVVNGEGEFLGGAILPGLHTGLKALTSKTAQLPDIEKFDTNIPVIGKNTLQNLQSGAAIGLACATEGFLSRIEEELGKKSKEIKVIVTGGHGPVILPYCRFSYFHDPSLLLEGLLSLGGV